MLYGLNLRRVPLSATLDNLQKNKIFGTNILKIFENKLNLEDNDLQHLLLVIFFLL